MISCFFVQIIKFFFVFCTKNRRFVPAMDILTQFKELKKFGYVPVSAGVLQSIYGGYKSPNMHIGLLEKRGALIRLKRGLYAVSPEVTGTDLSLGLIANHLYGPSYVSLHWALRFYGLIPERIETVTSITTRHTREFKTPLGRFTYRGVTRDYFPIGVKIQKEDGINYLLATPEKALCDMLLEEKHVPDQSVSALERFFEEDMRIDIDDIRQMDSRIIHRCMELGNKKQTLKNLLKLIRR